MIKIATIHGSPRKHHNSDTLLTAMLEGMKDEQIQVTDIYSAFQNIKPCAACNACAKKPGCVLKDDMQDVYRILDEADIVITTTPVYFHTVTAQLKTLIDRTQAVWSAKYVLGTNIISRKRRLGYALCTGGPPASKSFFDCTLKVLDIFHKCVNAKLVGHITVPNVDAVPIKEQEEILEQARQEGQRLVMLYKNEI